MSDMNETLQNPGLVEAMKAVKVENNRVTQSHVMAELLSAHLLIPVQIVEREQPDADGNTRTINFHLIKNVAQQAYFLAFTDITELRKWRNQPDQQTAVLTFDDYAALVLDAGSNAEGIAIDPIGENLIMTKDMVRTLRREMRIREGGGIDLSAIYPQLRQ